MAPDLDAIRRFLDGLTGRERRLLAVRALLRGVVAAALALVAAAAIVSVDLDRSVARALCLGGGVLAVLLALLVPAVGGMLEARDPLRQARLVERVQPALRSRLVTAVDRGLLADPARPVGSPVLLAIAVRKARETALGVSAKTVHPARPVARTGGFAALALLLTLLSGLVLPVGPLDAVATLLGGSAASARMASMTAEVPDERALIGDIVLRYVYPDYTGLEPREVPNSDGTIHAPPGTSVQISARTARSYDAAGFQVDDGEPNDATLSGGRDVSATLVVERDGAWRFVLFSGDGAELSPDYRIMAEADAVPVVTTSGDKQESRPVDQALDLSWQVSDDFGVERVVLEVEIDGQVQEFTLREPLDQPRELSGRVRMSPRELGLEPGDEAVLRVVANDNDRLAGSKRGVSSEVALEVEGPRTNSRRMTRYNRQLRDALIPVLADFLEEAVPPARTPEGVTRWVAQARLRFEPVRELRDAQWGDEKPTSIDATLVDRTLEEAARLFRFALTTFEPGTNRRVTEGDLATFAELHATEVGALEQAVWVLDYMLRQNALADVAEQADNVASEAAQLAELAQNDATAPQLLARLDKLERLMSELASAASQLSEGNLRQFVNSRIQETRNLMEEIRKAIAEGRMDDASAMLDQLAEQLQQLSEGLQEQMAGGGQGEDQLKERFEQAMEQLQQLEKDQEQLADELAEARKKTDGGVSDVMDAWAEVDRLIAASRINARTAAAAPGDGTGWRVAAVRQLDHSERSVDSLHDAVNARDAVGALERVDDASISVSRAAQYVNREGTRARFEGDQAPHGVTVAEAELGSLAKNLDRIEELLHELDEAGGEESEELQQLAQQLAQQQEALRERQQALGKDIKAIESAMPTSDGSATQSMERAGDAMERAGESLQYGEATTGEGHQRDAAGRLQAARQALEREMAEAQQMQQAMRQMRGEQGGDEGREGEQPLPKPDIEIPAPEAFQTPEAYRRALLEGMEGDVPDEFQALKKRYYEELVRQ